MKYSINLRMKSAGPTKFLIESTERNDFMEAFNAAKDMAERCDANHFVEVIDTYDNSKVAGFNETSS